MIEMIKKFISSIPNEQIRDKLKEAGIEEDNINKILEALNKERG